MVSLKQDSRNLLRYSLVVVWWATALASALELHGMSQQLLHDAGITNPAWTALLIGSGIALDLLLGHSPSCLGRAA